MVEGRELAVDGTLVAANASQRSRLPREQLAEKAYLSRTVREYLAEWEQENPVAESEASSGAQPQGASVTVSRTDPDAAWVFKGGRVSLL